MKSLPFLRGLQVKYYGPTNCRGSRVRIVDLRGIIKKPLWIPYSHECDGTIASARAYLEARGWVFEFFTEHHPSYILLTRDFRSETWEATRQPG